MKTTDGRSLSPEAQEEIRIRAIERVQAGESPEAVIKALGFSRQCIYNWLARYNEGGWDAREPETAWLFRWDRRFKFYFFPGGGKA